MNVPTTVVVSAELDELARQMAEVASAKDSAKMKELSRRHGERKELLGLLEQRDKVINELDELAHLADGEEEGLGELVASDRERVQAELEELDRRIASVLIERDPRDERNVILEIRAGAGGEEAALFAQELFLAYARFAESRGWGVHTVSSSPSEQGGFKEVIAEVRGGQVFGALKYERGVHRVQRVPDTEKQGRIHTSTVTVAVLPEAQEVDIEIKTEDLRIDTYRASGAGGQHVNKTSSAVRITHLPTNTVVAVQDERSQHKNKAKALSILRARLLDAREQEQRQKEALERRSQVGTGDRSEKIRTYNFPQDRITDHRIKQSWSDIPGVMAGGFGDIFQALRDAAENDQTPTTNGQSNPKS